MITADNITYKDDFIESGVEDKNYLRILFNGGRSVQIRELNQLQSILQSQIDKFGSSIYKSGAAVIGGNCTFDAKVYGITFSNTELGFETLSPIVPADVQKLSQGAGATLVSADVISFNTDEDTGTTTFYVRYSSSGGTDNSDNQFDIAEDITLESTIETGTGSAAPSGSAQFAAAFLSEGVFFVNGSFVVTPAQKVFIPVEDEVNGVTGTIVLEVDENYITYVQDQTLLDNAEGMPNHLAPGADRYQITLTLAWVASDDTDVTTNRIVLHEIANSGVVFHTKNRYSDLDRQLAQRTYEESGNYTVNPFKIEIDELEDSDRPGSDSVDAENFAYVGLDPSVAYVDGYRVQLTKRLDLSLEKARTTSDKQINVSLNIGNYVDITPAAGSALPLPNSAHLTYDLVDGTSAVVGSCRIKSIEAVGAIFRLFVYDVLLDPLTNFSDVATIENSVAGVELTVISSLQNATEDTGIFVLPYENVKSILQVDPSDFSYIIKKLYTGTANASGEFTITTAANETFTDTSLGNAIIESDGEWIPLSGITIIASSASSITFDGLVPSQSVKILFPVQVESNTPATKVLTEVTETAIAPTGTEYVLDNSDIYDIVSVEDSGSADDLAGLIEISFDGQTKTKYTNARLKYVGAGTPPSITVTYRHFVHNGLPFTANSYPINWDTNSPLADDEIRYENVPSFNGVRLNDVIDFRPLILDGGGTLNVIQPDPNSALECTPKFFLPRFDKVIVDSQGTFSIITGVPSINPVLPVTPPSAMCLYELRIPSYTFSARDIGIKMINNRRYTMRDIGEIDDKIKRLEYYTSLSLLETSANEKSIFDGDGQRFKNGILVDSFNGHAAGDVTNPAYRCSVDRQNQILRPFFKSDAVDLVVDTLTLSNARLNENTVTLDYTEVPQIQQLVSSESESVNPYDVASFVGSIKLYPTADRWVETSRRPNVIVRDDSAFDAMQFIAEETDILGTEWNAWETVWTGRTSRAVGGERIRGGRFFRRGRRGTETTTITAQTRTGITTTLESSIQTQNLGDRVVDISFVPFIRSRKVYFHAVGLKPLTRVYPFFDGVSIAGYCEEVDTVVKSSEVAEVREYLDKLPGSSNFITAENLVSDENGEVTGAFIVPNNSRLKFAVGERIFRLTDSSTNNSQEETTFAEGTYTASGQLQTVEATILSTRVPEFRQDRAIDARVLVDVRTRWSDPLAQTFLISDVPDGVFATSIDLWFTQKSSSSIPVTVRIVAVENGYPTQRVVPFSEVTLNAADVNIWSSDPLESEGPTKFEFSDPVYLKAGIEYAIVVISNDANYRIRVARLGGTDENGKRIQENPYGGVMFMSQNASTWTPDQTRDLKFVLNRAEFNIADTGFAEFKSILREGVSAITVTNGGTNYVGATVTISAPDTLDGIQAEAEADVDITSGTVTRIRVTEPGSGYVTNPTVTIVPVGLTGEDATATAEIFTAPVSTFNLLQGNLTPENTEIFNTLTFLTHEYQDVIPSETYIPTSEFTITRLNRATVTSEFGTGSNFLTPVIDLDNMALLTIHNQVNAVAIDETSELENEAGNALSRYICREVELNDPADQLNIYVDVNRPSANSNIYVYVKLKYDSATYSDWIMVNPITSVPITDQPDDFREVAYTYDSSANDFIAFKTKIVFTSTSTVNVTSAKNLRIIATS